MLFQMLEGNCPVMWLTKDATEAVNSAPKFSKSTGLSAKFTGLFSASEVLFVLVPGGLIKHNPYNNSI